MHISLGGSALLLPALLALAGCASEPPRAAPPMVAAGEPVNCVQISNIRDTRVRDDHTIDFRMNNSQVYRNTLPNSCPGLAMEKSFSYATSQSQLCNVDIITVIHTGAGPYRGASCGLGQFTPMKPAPASGGDAAS